MNPELTLRTEHYSLPLCSKRQVPVARLNIETHTNQTLQDLHTSLRSLCAIFAACSSGERYTLRRLDKVWKAKYIQAYLATRLALSPRES
jgi:hypothetical protein